MLFHRRGGWCLLILLVFLAFESAAHAGTVFESDAEWRWLKGTREASTPDTTQWRQPGFDDNGWESGIAPFFYGEPLSGTELSDMRGGYTSVFLRKKFVVPDPALLAGLRLRALSDDGFAAWINGQPVARFNVPEGEIPFDGRALGTFAEPLPTETYEINGWQDFLVPGTNVIAVQAFNASLSDSSDFVFEAAMDADIDDVAPQVERITPLAGSRVRELTQVNVQFSEAVEGVDATDLLMNGIPATRVTGFGGDQYLFECTPPGPGTVVVQWAADAGIRDRSALHTPFAGGTWNYVVDPNLPLPGVTLSEFMADNEDTLNDEDGDASDWIEIENTSDQAVNLAGWGLADSATGTPPWRFPEVSIPPRGYLVVFASGKNRTNATARLHTHFRLAREGGYLGLMRPNGQIASEFSPAYPPQSEDVSFGRLPTDPLKAGYFVRPTPGAPNAEGGPGYAAEVEFSRIGGTFLEPFSLSLHTSDPQATIRYTLNGEVPTESDAEYRQAITVSASTRVRARAFSPVLLPGPLKGESYVLVNPSAASATSSLPCVVLHGFGGGAVPADGEYSAFVSIYEPHGGLASLTNAPDLRSRARLNIRGSSTLFQPKRNYSIEFRDEREADRDLAPLGLPADSDWILYAPNNFEPILIHNSFIFRLSNEIGRYAPRTRFVEVYVQTGTGPVASSSYAGIYVLMEKIKRGSDRVDVANLEPEHTSPPQVTGGYILKIDRLDPGDSGLNAGGQQFGWVEPKELEMEAPQRAPQRTYIQNYLNRFNQALNGANWLDPLQGWRAYAEEAAWIDHHLLNVMAFNVDALRLSTYFYKPREGKLAFGPIWDFDRALNSTDGRDSNPRRWRSGESDLGTDFFNHPWWGRLFRDPDFWQRWIDRYQALRGAEFSTNHLFALVDEMTGEVRSAQPREAARWPGFTTPRGSYQNEINGLKSWLTRRLDFMDTNFLALPKAGFASVSEGTPPRVTLTGPPGATLYYTADGSDPRSPGGGISGSAKIYASPVALTWEAPVRARSYNPGHRNLTGANNPPISSPWSGMIEVVPGTVPGLEPRKLAFAEIHPRPAAPSAVEQAANPLLGRSDFEFIEIANPGTNRASLLDLRFTRGVAFHFRTSSIPVLEPGARLLLVRNRAAFALRYGALSAIAGEYQGSLDASSETLRLEDGAGNVVAEARFGTGPFPTADGLGFSLVATDDRPGSGHGTVQAGGAWRVSARTGGSPGTQDPDSEPVAPVVINEALTHTDPPQRDGIELFNPGPGPAEIGGWFLSDTRSAPFKFRIPSGTRISPGGYLWLDETAFNADTNAPTSFLLNSTGDQVWLFAADAGGNLQGYAHGFDFGAAENGVSFGRELSCDGQELFLPQITVTPGAANAGPRPSPVVITEIHYHPPDVIVGAERWDDAALEFVEVANVTDSPVPLFDPLNPTNAWRLKDAVAYTFPTNLTLAPRGVVVVVNFNPQNDPQALARFRSSFQVPADVPLFGPYAGSLPNDEGRMELARPDIPQPLTEDDAGFVPYLVVDRVHYTDQSPWTSQADGSGRSLQRVAFSGIGNESHLWVAAPPTPGSLPLPGFDTDGDGLPDSWEAVHCLDPNDPADALRDLDGDGAANGAEYAAQTDPGDPGDVLVLSALGIDDTGRLQLAFTAKAGVAYAVEAADLLSPSGWTRIGEIPVSGQTRTASVQALVGAGPRYFRVVIPVRP